MKRRLFTILSALSLNCDGGIIHNVPAPRVRRRGRPTTPRYPATRMANQPHINFLEMSDSLAVAILGFALLAGKVAGAVASPANFAVAAGTLLAAGLLLLADFRVLRGRWAWSGWLLLLLDLAAFALVNLSGTSTTAG